MRATTCRIPARIAVLCFLFVAAAGLADEGDSGIPPLPAGARLALEEDWSSGSIDPERWYALRKQWGQGNFGVVPENVSLVSGVVDGTERPVLRCEAHGDRYTGPVTGQWDKHERVGGVLVTKQHFASGRFEVVMKIGTPELPQPPGMVPAIWTYGSRLVRVDEAAADEFSPSQPLYHPYLQQWGKGMAFYWSEIDFPEFGKAGDYAEPMYNTFLNKMHHTMAFDVHGAADGRWHAYTTDWRTHLVPVDGVADDQVAEAEGYFWVQDKGVPYEKYWGNPLKRLGEDQYAVYSGRSARHWVDGSLVGENAKFVPAMSGQLNLGVWLPDWAGEAPWETATVDFASVKVWQFGDQGDVTGVLTGDIEDSFDNDGQPLPQ
ncbi:hypothetical protein BH23VER1_BH23VER1_36350 [soil metagenome]